MATIDEITEKELQDLIRQYLATLKDGDLDDYELFLTPCAFAEIGLNGFVEWLRSNGHFSE